MWVCAMLVLLPNFTTLCSISYKYSTLYGASSIHVSFEVTEWDTCICWVLYRLICDVRYLGLVPVLVKSWFHGRMRCLTLRLTLCTLWMCMHPMPTDEKIKASSKPDVSLNFLPMSGCQIHIWKRQSSLNCSLCVLPRRKVCFQWLCLQLLHSWKQGP